MSMRDIGKPPTMSDDEKRRFYELAQKDAERYQAEVAAYGGEDAMRKRKRAKKDPNAPKRALYVTKSVLVVYFLYNFNLGPPSFSSRKTEDLKSSKCIQSGKLARYFYCSVFIQTMSTYSSFLVLMSYINRRQIKVAQELGRMWKNVSMDEKDMYERKALADKERYAEVRKLFLYEIMCHFLS
ncbi:hypothetical protein ANCDUO_06482 [Ancylostoma duodenale]|uniref:HMG box domain-containing protein n=1 Tax=Ancylostoma duodenale TaxID=51022 RepID=A0A0C2DKV3_9BILA|nr:hypothetical protein ANCDUO_06482 [Ancylostoma duodenale]